MVSFTTQSLENRNKLTGQVETNCQHPLGFLGALGFLHGALGALGAAAVHVSDVAWLRFAPGLAPDVAAPQCTAECNLRIILHHSLR
jgi:hypothetical protein